MNLRYIIAIGLYCAFLFYISTDPEAPKPPGFTFDGVDKLGHFGAYAILAAFAAFGLRGSRADVSPAAIFFLPLTFAFGYSLALECFQLFLPNRFFEVLDLFANFLGALAAQSLLCFAVWRYPLRRTFAPLYP